MNTIVRPALVLLTALTVVTGIAYPLAVTGIARLAFPWEANGSLVTSDGRVAGSALIGQSFRDPGHFWGRPSATGPFPYNAGASSGSNLGPSNPALVEAVKGRIAALEAADPTHVVPIPVDLVTASGSGLDPHISVAAARYQAVRVARWRKLPLENVQDLIDRHTEGRALGFIGEPRVNVLKLNLDLDRLRG